MREYIAGDVIANTIRMARSGFAGAFIIVEGSDDARLYKRFVNSNMCKVIPALGKVNAVGALTILERENFSGVLAIVDADFMVLEDKMPDSKLMFLTDTHDLETMLIKSPALETVLSEYDSEAKINAFMRRTGKDVRSQLIESGTPIGYLRWMSLQDNLSLKFESLEFSEFIDRNNLTLDVTELIRSVKNMSLRPDIAEDAVKKKMNQLKKDTHDHWYICCGHDLVNILSLGLRKALASQQLNDVSKDRLEKALRLSFAPTYFRETRLYSSLENWERANPPYQILNRES